MPCALPGKPRSASKQVTYWYHESLTEKDAALPCLCRPCRCTTSRTGEAEVPGKIKLPSAYIDKPVPFVVPSEAVVGISVPPSRRLEWSYINSCGMRSLRSPSPELDRSSGLEQWRWVQEMLCCSPADPGSCLPALSTLALQAANMERVIINLILHPSSPLSIPGMTTHTWCPGREQFLPDYSAAYRQWFPVQFSREICFECDFYVL